MVNKILSTFMSTLLIFNSLFSNVSINRNELVKNNIEINKENEEVDALEIRDFNVQFFYGADLNANNDYVWNAPSSTPGHRFSFRINYAISGQFELLPNSIEMRIPKSILKDRDGNGADTYEMSIPTKKEVDDGEEIDMDINYAYYEDGDDIVIYNFRNVYTGENGYIELSYFTSKSTFYYYDYDGNNSTNQDKSKDFYGTIKVTGNDKTVSKESEHFNVYINTNAIIQSVDKQFPTKYETWNPEWGEEIENANEYYYLIWEVRSIVSPGTQPYNFTLVDHDLSDGEIIGIRNGNSGPFNLNQTTSTINNQYSSGYRYDYVLTKHPITWWIEQGDHVEITNNVTATVDPIDQVDPDTTESDKAIYVWNRPQFIHPMGWYDSWKRADRSYLSRDGLDYLGMKAGEYSRYNLEDLQEGRVTYLDDLDYAVWFEGYPYLHTVRNATDIDDPSKYWEVPVKYELYDYIFYLYDEADGVVEPNVGTDDETYGIPIQEYIDARLTYEDFQIDSLSFGTTKYQDATFSEGAQRFSGTSVTYKAEEFNDITTDILEFYILFKDKNTTSDWKLVSTYNLETKDIWFDENYVSGMTDNKINFKDNVVGYKVETYSKHYHTRIDLVPNIRLKNSSRVLALINNQVGGGVNAIGILNSETANFYPYNGSNFNDRFITRSESASDYLRKSVRNSHIQKTITATSNIVRRKRYTINWKINMDEIYTVGDGEQHPINQDSGTFYDYLPSGSILNEGSIAVANEKGFLQDSDFSYETVGNYNGSGKTLLTVRINEPGDNYTLYYETIHPWDSIKDWGNDIYNPVAYETGNRDLSPFNDEGEREANPDTIRNLFDDIVNNSSEDKFIYADTNYDISILTAAAANLHKKVKDSTDEDYSYDTWTVTNGNYSYRWRYQNTFNTKAKDLIFFDTLENYPVEQDDHTFKKSDWYGTFQSIDLTQLREKGIEPVVYYSSIEDLNVDDLEGRNHDITNTSVWKPLTDSTDLSTVKALAVDCRKKTNGEDFVLDAGDSISVIIHMKAPTGVYYQGDGYPESYNNIYLENTTIDENGGSQHFYIHQDYTTIRLKVVGDVNVLKVNEENNQEVIPGIKFRLYGTSNYGTEIDLVQTTGKNGKTIFEDVEMGEYILQEYETNPDWLEDHTEHKVIIDEYGRVTIDGQAVLETEDFTITNKPRVHGELLLEKRREGTGAVEQAIIEEIISKGIGGTVVIDGYKYEIVGTNVLNASLKFAGYEGTYAVIDRDKWLVNSTTANAIPWFNTHGPRQRRPNYGPVPYTTFERNTEYTEEEILNLNTIHRTLSKRVDDGSTEYKIYVFVENSNAEVVYWWSDADYIKAPEDASYFFRGIYEAMSPDYSMFQLEIDLTDIDFSNTTNMKAMFLGQQRLSKLHGLDKVITSNVQNFSQMFRTAMYADGEPFEYLDLSSWDTSSVTDMSDMFENTNNLKKINVNGWDVRNVTNMNSMFWMADHSSWNNEPLLKEIDLSSWNPESLPDTRYMFYNNVNLEKIYVSELWKQAQTNDKSENMFRFCYKLRNYDYSTYNYAKSNYTETGYLTYKEPTEVDNSLAYSLVIRPTHPIENTTFKLSGISDYGNQVTIIKTTDADGHIHFDDVEIGTYELVEIKENEEYVLNKTKWKVYVDETGKVKLLEPTEEKDKDRLYDVEESRTLSAVYNEPRYWDFKIRKVDKDDNTIFLEGATLNLLGVSDLGTAYNITKTTDANGFIHFERIEKGKYVLKETKAPTGVDENGKSGGNINYLNNEKEYVVTIDYKGTVDIKGLNVNDNGEFEFENEKAYDGKIIVTKKWKDGLSGTDAYYRETPKLHLITKDPTTLEYTVRYNALDGTFENGENTNVVKYKTNYLRKIGDDTTKDTIISGEIFEASKDDYSFAGWYLDTEFKKAYDPTKYYGEEIDVYAKFTRILPIIDNSKFFTLNNKQSWYLTRNTTLTKDEVIALGATRVDIENCDKSIYAWKDGNTLYWWSDSDKIAVPENANRMFYNTNFYNLDLRDFDTSNTTNMSLMFYYNNYLSSINISNWDTSNVTDMGMMFGSCDNLASIDVSNLDTSNVTNMYEMFYYLPRITELDLSNFDTRNVENMSGMFEGDSGLVNLNISSFDTNKVVSMNSMFSECSSLTSLDLANFDTKNVEDFRYMFWDMTSLTSLDLSSFDTSSVTQTTYMFENDNNLENIYVSDKWDISGIDSSGDMFYGCSKLPNYDENVVDKTNAHYNDGGYLTYKEAPTPSGNPTPPTPTSTDVEYVSEEGVNENNHWERLSDNTWRYTFDVLDDSLKYYLYEEDIDGYVSDYTNYIIVNEGEVGKQVTITNTKDNSFSSIKLSKEILPGNIYSETEKETKTVYSHTENVNDDGERISETYEQTIRREVITIPNAEQIQLTIKYGLSYYDHLYIIPGEYSKEIDDNIKDYIADYNSGSTTVSEKTLTVEGDTVTIIFKCDERTSIIRDYYGYYVKAEAEAPKVVGTVDNVPEIEKQKEFEFTVNLYGDNFEGPKVYSDILFIDGVATVKLKDGESITINDLPKETKYFISEVKQTPYEGEIIDYEGQTYIDDTGDHTYYSYTENRDSLGRIIGEAQRDWNNSNIRGTNREEPNNEAHVITVPGAKKVLATITYTGNNSSSSSYTCLYKGSVPTATCSSNAGTVARLGRTTSTVEYIVEGDTVTFSFMTGPTGSGYLSRDAGYFATVQDYDQSKYKIAKDVEVLAKNYYTTTERKPVDIAIKKQVIGNSVDNNAEYELLVNLTGLLANGIYALDNGETYTANDNGEANVFIKLKNNESVKLKDIPIGATYQVTELSGNYIASYNIKDNNNQNSVVLNKNSNSVTNKELSTGVEVADKDEDIEILFTNEVNKYLDFTLNKKVIGEDLNKEFNFNIVLTNLKPNTRYDSSLGRLVSDGDGIIERDVILKNNSSIEFYNLPLGAKYQIKEEDYSREGYEVNILTNVNSNINNRLIEGTIEDGENIEITYTNIERKVISGTKKWIDDNLEHYNSQEITLKLYRESINVSKEKVSENDYELEWVDNTYYFKDLDRVDEYGDEYEYSVIEETIDNYTTTIDEYDITNTKQKGKLTIKKIVEGETIDNDKEFEFVVSIRNSQGKPISGEYSGVLFNNNGEATIKLKHNEEKTIELYVDVEYEVKEKDYSDEGYICIEDEYSKGNITIEEINTTIINAKTSHSSLIIQKKLSGNDTNSNDEFEFEIVLNEKLNGIYNDVEFKDGKARFKLKANEVKTIENLPLGIKYTVNEIDSKNYISSNNGNEGIIKEGEYEIIIFTNSRSRKPPVPNTSSK